jgi:hypothetical protein
MAEPDKRPVTLEELLVSSLPQTDALAKLLIEKGLITREEFMQKDSWVVPQVGFFSGLLLCLNPMCAIRGSEWGAPHTDYDV